MIKKIYKNISALGSIPADTPCLLYYRDRILVLKQDNKYLLPCHRDLNFIFEINFTFFMTKLNGLNILIADLVSPEVPDNFFIEETRDIYHYFSPKQRDWIAKSFGHVHWFRMHRFCGRCGQETIFDEAEVAMLCQGCHQYHYPKVNPSIIVLVHRKNEFVLARSPHFPPGLYSTLAGYVAPGETLEETVIREVKEEVNIEVKNIRYFTSQAWPFPDMLMLGFYAEYAGGVLQVDGKEIEAADWFTADNLPLIPKKISIAWQLIDGFIQGDR